MKASLSTICKSLYGASGALKNARSLDEAINFMAVFGKNANLDDVKKARDALYEESEKFRKDVAEQLMAGFEGEEDAILFAQMLSERF